MNKKYLKHLSPFESFLELPPPEVSFEFFPPGTPEMEKILWEAITKLKKLNPTFVSVTYGAGGSTRERTHQTIERILKETNLTPAAHLTCIGATKEEIDSIAKDYWEMGVKHIVALRGDPPPTAAGKYTPHLGGYPYCADLVKGLKNIADFEISVAAFPQIHPEAVSQKADLDYLKKKIDAGATRAITQYFFDTDVYLSFLEKAEKAGIKVPIVPGIILISNFKQLINFSRKCSIEIPKWIYKLLDGLEEYPEKHDIIASMIAAEQCRILREAGVNKFHFYTLNRPLLATSVCHVLGVR